MNASRGPRLLPRVHAAGRYWRVDVAAQGLSMYTDRKGYKTPNAPANWPFGRTPPAPIQDAPF